MRIVRIRWRDACVRNESDNNEVVIWNSYGILVERNDDKIVIAQSMSEDDDSQTETLTIPVENLLSVRTLATL